MPAETCQRHPRCPLTLFSSTSCVPSIACAASVHTVCYTLSSCALLPTRVLMPRAPIREPTEVLAFLFSDMLLLATPKPISKKGGGDATTVRTHAHTTQLVPHSICLCTLAAARIPTVGTSSAGFQQYEEPTKSCADFEPTSSRWQKARLLHVGCAMLSDACVAREIAAGDSASAPPGESPGPLPRWGCGGHGQAWQGPTGFVPRAAETISQVARARFRCIDGLVCVCSPSPRR